MAWDPVVDAATQARGCPVEIAEPLTALVTRILFWGEFSLASDSVLERLIRDARHGDGGGLLTAERWFEAAADLLASAGLAKALSADRPIVEEVAWEGVRYRRMTFVNRGVYFGRRGRFEVKRNLSAGWCLQWTCPRASWMVGGLPARQQQRVTSSRTMGEIVAH
jgi:hypothetical protein